MTAGLLFDTHALIWFVAGERMTPAALAEIARAQATSRLFVSAITAWEVALALLKPSTTRRPNLGGLDAVSWFRSIQQSAGVRVVDVDSEIAAEAAAIVAQFRISDPGDCHIVATARHLRLSLVTRDAAILRLSRDNPSALQAIAC